MKAKRRYGSRIKISPGAPPATLVADQNFTETRVNLLAYGTDDQLLQEAVQDMEQIRGLTESWPVVWVNVNGLRNIETITRLGEIFGLHPLALEDVLAHDHRPKIEEYGDHLFMILQTPEHSQLGIFFNRRFVVTFQDGPAEYLEPLYKRILKKGGRIRSRGADYLAYALTDSVVDHFFPVLDRLGERLEDLEDMIIRRPGEIRISQIHEVKRDLLGLNRSLWPLRDTLTTLMREEPDMIDPEVRPYLRDCNDHVLHLIDQIITFRDAATALSDMYLTSLSNRMNEIMKVLTIIATMFIPLTFITGLYGMNFDTSVSPFNMPELHWYYGYPAVLAIMAVLVAGLLMYFKNKKWL